MSGKELVRSLALITVGRIVHSLVFKVIWVF